MLVSRCPSPCSASPERAAWLRVLRAVLGGEAVGAPEALPWGRTLAPRSGVQGFLQDGQSPALWAELLQSGHGTTVGMPRVSTDTLF